MEPASNKAGSRQMELRLPKKHSLSRSHFLGSSAECESAFSNRLTVEVRGQVLSEKRIVFCPRHRFLDMIIVIALRADESDESCGEFHFRIRPSQANGFPYPAMSVQGSRRVRLALAQPL